MTSPLLFVFFLQIAIHIINAVGKQYLTDLVYNAYSKLTTPSSSSSQPNLRNLRADLVRLNRELTATSAQDQFAKWAKLRREIDKKQAQYDTLSRNEASLQGTLSTAITVLRFLGTQGLQFGANFYYGKTPMFFLPRGWVPYPVEWILSFPRAPLGSVSVNVWAIACACVVGLLKEALVGLWSIGTGEVAPEKPKAKFKASGTDTKNEKEKKEL